MENLLAFALHQCSFALRASVSTAGQKLHFRFELEDPKGEVEGAPVPGVFANLSRADGLWQRTCFEAFFAEEGAPGYWELNMAPDGSAWNLYRFEGYRVPQPPRACEDFLLEMVSIKEGSLDCWLLPRRQTGALEVSLCSVVKTAGRTHYLAAAHAGEKADFHLRASFRLKLPGFVLTEREV